MGSRWLARLCVGCKPSTHVGLVEHVAQAARVLLDRCNRAVTVIQSKNMRADRSYLVAVNVK